MIFYAVRITKWYGRDPCHTNIFCITRGSYGEFIATIADLNNAYQLYHYTEIPASCVKNMYGQHMTQFSKWPTNIEVPKHLPIK